MAHHLDIMFYVFWVQRLGSTLEQDKAALP